MNLKHLVVTALCLSVSLTTVATASDINLIGNFSLDAGSDSVKAIDANNISAVLTDDLGNGMKAEARVDITDMYITLNEAFITVENPFAAIGLDNVMVDGLSASAGKKYLSVGMINTRQNEELPFVARPNAVTKILGDDAATGEGADVSYMLPTSFDSSIQIGAWKTSDLGYGESSSTTIRDASVTVRASGSKEVAQGKLSLGFSSLMKSALASENSDKTTVLGFDAYYTQPLFKGNVHVAFEYLGSTYYDTADAEQDATNMYLYAGYNCPSGWAVGALYDNVGETAGAKSMNETSLIVTRTLSEKAKARIQYGTGLADNAESSISGQLIFGLGSK